MMIGLTFQESREIVSQKLRGAVSRIKNERIEKWFQHIKENLIPIITYIIINFVVIILLFITIGNHSLDMYYGLIVVACIVLVISFSNIVFYAKTREAKELEVILALTKIIDEFDDGLKIPTKDVKITGEVALEYDILAGHAQISIVSCYRNGDWHRIPTLLLAQGDVIALQCGDITPGKCFEVNTASLGSSVDLSSKAEPNNNYQKPLQQPQQQHHQSPHVPTYKDESIFSKPESEAILPYEAYKNLAASSDNNIGLVSDNESISPSLPESVPMAPPSNIQTQKPVILKKGTKIFRSSDVIGKHNERRNFSFQRHRALASDGVELLTLSGDMRCFQMESTPVEAYVENVIEGYKKKGKSQRLSLIQMFLNDVLKRSMTVMALILVLFVIASIIKFSIIPSDKYHWGVVLTEPIAAILICFIPLFLPAFLIVSDSILTANFLATTEAMILDDSSVKSRRAKVKSPDRAFDGGDNQKARYRNSNGKSGNRGQSSVKQNMQNVDSDLEFNNISAGADARSEQSSLNDISEDEFRDEDIDERVEELAEEASHRVLWTRVMQYALIVLCRRLNLTRFQSFLSRWISVDQMLSIPPSKSKLLEFLGGITMVCFIDDDVICEGFSVSEEIFILKNNDQRDATGFNSALSESHGVILDLHANPEAHGSRFENPNWWKYLPSLKPIGLNAMLTYAPMPAVVAAASNVGSGSLTAENLREQELQRGSSNLSRQRKHHHGHKRNLNRHVIEKSLVRQVRKSIPIESLRELAEEIGFSSDDVQVFRKVLEMNVIAPGLLDTKLMDDTHAWGQEETRRRGSLMTQVRSSVVLDTRSGGLQMMSQGDPALILHYCSDYWDGKSIAPFTSSDRTEILSVYDRWNLEDFDVVAFAYTPISIDLRKRILQSQNIDIDGLQSKHGVRKRNGSVANTSSTELNTIDKQLYDQNISESPSIYIVDPYTSQDLQLMRQQYLEVINSIKVAATKNSSLPVDFNLDSSELQASHISVPDCLDCESASEGMKKSKTPPTTPLSGAKKASLFPVVNPDLLWDIHMLPSQSSMEESDNSCNQVSNDIEQSTGPDESEPLVQYDSESVDATMTTETKEHENKPSEPLKLMSFFRDMRAVNLERSKSPSAEYLKSPNPNPNPSITGAPTSLTQRIRRFFTRSSGESLSASVEYDDGIDSQSQAYTLSEDASQLDPDLAAVADTDTDLINMTSPYTLLHEMDDIDDLDPELDGMMESESDVVAIQTRLLIQGEDIEDENMTTVGLRLSKTNEDDDVTINENESSKLLQPGQDVFIPERRQIRSKSFHEYSIRNDIFEGATDDYIDFKRRASSGAFAGLSDFKIPAVLSSSKSASSRKMSGKSTKVGENVVVSLSSEKSFNDTTKVYFEELPVEVEETDNADVVILKSKRISASNNSAPGTPRSSTIHVPSRRSESHLKVDSMHVITSSRDDSVVDYRSRGHSDLSHDHSHPRDKDSVGSGGAHIREPMQLLHPDEDQQPLFVNIDSKVSGDGSGRKKIPRAHSSPEQLHRMGKTTETTQRSKTRALPPSVKVRSVGASLWPFMRSQVLLGMAASSVPIKTEVADFREELTKAGIRFVYFSPRNMRRSKSVAEKLGIQFDWNCAISLRALDDQEVYDPHRAISNYGDWDVHAKLPHGVAAIRKHLREIDNVPLLVSLYTDATPETVNDMVGVFQEYGEVVMTIGSAYRELNQQIFATSDVSVAVAMLPGDTKDVPISVEEVVARFPVASSNTLTQHDLLLHFHLVSLGSIPLLQTQARNRSHVSFTLSKGESIVRNSNNDASPTARQGNSSPSHLSQLAKPVTPKPIMKSHLSSQHISSALETIQEDVSERPQDGGDEDTATQVNETAAVDGDNINNKNNSNTNTTIYQPDNHVVNIQLDMFEDHRLEVGKVIPQELQLSALLEGIRMGRVYLLNFVQAIAGMCVCSVGMALWSLFSMAIPINIPPFLPPSWAIIFMLFHIPILLLAMLNNEEHEHVMKNTPRKNKYVQRRDEERFVYYLAIRAGYIGISVFLVGWITSSVLLSAFNGNSWAYEMTSYNNVLSLTSGNSKIQPFVRQFWLLQDVMASELLLSMIAQLLTMQSRGQSWKTFPHPLSHPWFYLAILVSFSLQLVILYIRAHDRVHFLSLQDDGTDSSIYTYTALDYRVWVSLFVLPVGGLIIGMMINSHDAKFYQRYMQFLRFDFETKLGQYSPR